jgi:predicted esterase
LAVYGAGKIDGNARLSVIYLHGKDGTREWGFDDERFGGNFSRVKTLVVKNGGAYFSPDFTNFDKEGSADISALVDQIAQKNGNNGSSNIILACGSMGVQICWSLANKASIRNQLSGIIILGGFPDSGFLRSAYSGAAKPLPLYIAHGSRDPVYDVEALEDFYNALTAKDYPVRMSVFDTGNHGTPVRMIDWRQALNWIMSK